MLRAVRILVSVTLFLLPVLSLQALTWTSPPANLSTSGANADEPQVAMNSAGRGVAVWEWFDGSNTRIQTASSTDGITWTTPVFLSASGQNAATPQISVNSAGIFVAVWARFDGSDFVIQAASSTDGILWTPASSDLSAPGQNAFDPQISIGDGGRAVAVWIRFNGSNYIVQAASSPDGINWTPASGDLSAPGQNGNAPQVAVGSDGTAVAVWQRSNGANDIIQAATSSDGVNWTPAAADLTGPGEDAGDAHVAIDGTGRSVAVWSRNDSSMSLGARVIQAATSIDGINWTPASADLSSPAQFAQEPQVAIDSSGRAVSVWLVGETFASVGFNAVQAATSLDGVNWTSASADLSLPGQDSGGPQVVINDSGNAIVVWPGFDGSNYIVQSASSSDGVNWTPSTNDLSFAGQDAVLSQVAMNNSGTAVTVWKRSNGSNVIIQGVFTLVASPQNLTGSQRKNDFGVEYEWFNLLRWTADPSQTPVGYFVFRNGLLIATLSAHASSYEDHNRVKGLATVYSVTAFDANGNQSPPVTVTVP